MNNSDFRILRGVSIATLVFAILGALAGGAFLALMVSASSMLSDPDFFNMFVEELQRSSSGSAAFDGSSAASTYDFSTMNDEQIREAATLGMNVVIAMAAGYLILHVVGVVASIMNLRAVNEPEKLRRAFIWTVIAAVCSAVVFSIITCVCFIVAAWLNARIRKSFAAYNQGFPGYPGGMPGGMPGSGGMPGGAAGPYGQGGYGSVPPQQPMQPQQPVMPQQLPPQQQVPQQPMPQQQPVGQQPIDQPQQPAQPQQPVQQTGQSSQQPAEQPQQAADQSQQTQPTQQQVDQPAQQPQSVQQQVEQPMQQPQQSGEAGSAADSSEASKEK